MYTVAVERDLIAQHFLFGGDWGRENSPHAHHYRIETLFHGNRLDEHGYLIDITIVDDFLDAVVERYRDCTLNNLPEFSGLNPSIEHFARILCDGLAARLDKIRISAIEVKVRETDRAWASCTREFQCG